MIQPLLELINRFDLRMALPAKIPTLQALSTGNWTCPDNVWCSSHSSDLFTSCDTDPGQRGPNTNHVPIMSKLDFPLNHNIRKLSRNFHNTDWETFNEHLAPLLSPQPSKRIRTNIEFHIACTKLSRALKTTIKKVVPLNTPFPFTKRWWSHNLSVLRKRKN